MAHLVLPKTKADPSQKPKELFTANVPTEINKFEN
jgi:hypothetical protein